jgi:hypothetical protein
MAGRGLLLVTPGSFAAFGAGKSSPSFGTTIL